jgi:hypothetical protein
MSRGAEMHFLASGYINPVVPDTVKASRVPRWSDFEQLFICCGLMSYL